MRRAMTRTALVRRTTATVGFAAVVVLTLACAAPGAVGAIDLASRGLDGQAGNSASRGVGVNRDGSVVAFFSDATNLVLADRNSARDVFVWDTRNGLLERISVDGDGVAGNRDSHATGGAPSVSVDGNVVAFYSDASNLVANDTNAVSDVFVRVRDLGIGAIRGATELVSLGAAGEPANGASLYPSLSADGRFIAFQSLATNLIDGDTNGAADVFVYDRETGITERACDTVEPNGFSFAPALSADGNALAFASSAANLVTGDTNGAIDVFVCTRNRANGSFAAGSLERVSLSTAGAQGNADSIVPAISGSGCFVAFKSEADNLAADDRNHAVDVFLRVRGADVTELVSARDPAAGLSTEGATANDASFPPSLSGDGRFVAFGSFATNLLVGDVNQFASVYVRDRQTGKVRLVDVNDRGVQADAGTPDSPPSVSGDGHWIGFDSAAGNLTLPGIDANFRNDVFRADNPVVPDTVETVCCDCSDQTCAQPEDGICPTGCVPVCDAVCSDPGVPGVTCLEPTPTATGTVTGTPTATASATQTAEPSATPTVTPTTPASATPTEGSPTPGTQTPGTQTPGTATPGTQTPGTATPGTRTPVTATPTHARTATPTPDIDYLDEDSCAVIAPERQRNRGGLVWMLLPAAALLAARRRRP